MATNLVITLNGASGDVRLRMNTGVIEYYNTTTPAAWTPIGSGDWPVQFVNSNLSSVLRVVATQNLTITGSYGGTSGYFVAGSTKITFDGSGNTITLDTITAYPGFIQNGTSGADGFANVIVQNFTTAISGGSTLASSAGWLCQSYFGKASAGNQIISCTNTGAIGGTYAGGIAGKNVGVGISSVTFTRCNNTGTISGNGAGGIVGGSANSTTITNCFNIGTISGTYAGGIAGDWFGYNGNGYSEACSMSNCYSTGAINGTNAGGIVGAGVGFTDNASFDPYLFISKCYSLGAIASTAGGICGGIEGSYVGNPSVSIENSYSWGVLTDSESGIVATSLPITPSIFATYVANGAWTDASANANFYDPPTSNPGTTWTKVANNTTTPYVLSSFNAQLYSPNSTISAGNYTTSAGLFTDPSYNYQILYNYRVGNNQATTGVFVSKGTTNAPYYYSYNTNTFTLNTPGTAIDTINTTITPSNGILNYVLTLALPNPVITQTPSPNLIATSAARITYTDLSYNIVPDIANNPTYTLRTTNPNLNDYDVFLQSQNAPQSFTPTSLFTNVSFPGGITRDVSGNIYVVSLGGSGITPEVGMYTPVGGFIRKFTIEGGFTRLRYCGVDTSNNILYVASENVGVGLVGINLSANPPATANDPALSILTGPAWAGKCRQPVYRNGYLYIATINNGPPWSFLKYNLRTNDYLVAVLGPAAPPDYIENLALCLTLNQTYVSGGNNLLYFATTKGLVYAVSEITGVETSTGGTGSATITLLTTIDDIGRQWELRSITTDPSGNIYTGCWSGTMSTIARISPTDPDRHNLTNVTYGGLTMGDSSIRGLLFDGSMNLYITDIPNSRVLLTRPKTFTFGGPGSIVNGDAYYGTDKRTTYLTDASNNQVATSFLLNPAECFKKGTKILSENDVYIPIEELKIGDLVKTYKRGYQKVIRIANSRLCDYPRNTLNQLYMYSRENNPKLIEDLYLTGGHSLLFDTLTEKEATNMNQIHWPDDEYMVEDKYKLLACLSRELYVAAEQNVEIYHFTLEPPKNANPSYVYGVYANGILAESCSQSSMDKTLGQKRILTNPVVIRPPNQLPTSLVYNDSIDTTNMTNVVLIDSIVANHKQFYDSANTNTFPIIYNYNSSTDDLLALLRKKFTASSIQRISLVFHDKGENCITQFMNGKRLFDNSDLEENQTSFTENVSFLTSCIKEFHVGHIDYLACNTLQYSNWKSYYALIASQTSVVVGASNNETGNIKYGGDWIMENTNENVRDLYFNTNISNYASTLVLSIITLNGASGDVGLRMNTGVIEYYNTTTTTWTAIGSGNWPVQFVNSNLSSVLRVVATQNLTITGSYGGILGYFIAGSTKITFDGSGNTITMNTITDYPGFIQNGTSGANGFANIIVKNFTTAISGGSTLASGGGWLCQSYFGKGSSGNQIISCTNTGAIGGNQGGGIAGQYAGIGNISSANLSFTGCSNTGTISGNGAGGIVGGSIYSATITNCFNIGTISGTYAGGITGDWAGYNNSGYPNGCIISRCYSTGAINGTNAGGIVGAGVGFTDNASFNPYVEIDKCYSLGAIASTAGGICGGAEGSYVGTPSVFLSNSYSWGVLTDPGSGIVATSLPISPVQYDIYVANGAWTDASANANLQGNPPGISSPGAIWTKIANNTTTPYVLSSFNAQLYNPNSATTTSTYTTSAGLFTDPSYNYQILYNNISGYTATTGVFVSKVTTSPYYYSYNTNTFMISSTGTAIDTINTTITPSTGVLNYLITLGLTNLVITQTPSPNLIALSPATITYTDLSYNIVPDISNNPTYTLRTTDPIVNDYDVFFQSQNPPQSFTPNSLFINSNLNSPGGIVRDGSGNLYVVNLPDGAVGIPPDVSVFSSAGVFDRKITVEGGWTSLRYCGYDSSNNRLYITGEDNNVGLAGVNLSGSPPPSTNNPALSIFGPGTPWVGLCRQPVYQGGYLYIAIKTGPPGYIIKYNLATNDYLVLEVIPASGNEQPVCLVMNPTYVSGGNNFLYFGTVFNFATDTHHIYAVSEITGVETSTGGTGIATITLLTTIIGRSVWSITSDPSGNIYAACTASFSGPAKIARISPSDPDRHNLTNVALSPSGTQIAGRVRGLFFDGSMNLYVGDESNDRILKTRPKTFTFGGPDSIVNGDAYFDADKRTTYLTDLSNNQVLTSFLLNPAECFKKGTKILSENDVYIPIEELKIGDLVKTYKHGYQKIIGIANSRLCDYPRNTLNQLYTYSREKNPELIEDLHLTGGHSLLLDTLTEEESNSMNQIHWPDDEYMLEDKYKLLAHLSHDICIAAEQNVEIYHFTLEPPENARLSHVYGVYANGVLAESCSHGAMDKSLEKKRMLCDSNKSEQE